jgi:dynactin-5
LKDCCAIAPGAVVPPETIVAPYAYYEGSPGKLFQLQYKMYIVITFFFVIIALCVDDLPECTKELMVDFAETFYQNFKPI